MKVQSFRVEQIKSTALNLLFSESEKKESVIFTSN